MGGDVGGGGAGGSGVTSTGQPGARGPMTPESRAARAGERFRTAGWGQLGPETPTQLHRPGVQQGGNKCLLSDGWDLRATAEPGDRPSWASGLALLRWVGRHVSLGLWVPSWPCAPRLPTFHVYSLSLAPDGAPTVCLELPHDAGSSPPAPMALPQSPAPYTPQT